MGGKDGGIFGDVVVEGLGAWLGIEHEVDEGGGIFGKPVGMVFGELVGIENEVGRKVLVDLFGARWPTGQVMDCKVLGDLVVIVLGELVGIEHEVGGKFSVIWLVLVAGQLARIVVTGLVALLPNICRDDALRMHRQPTKVSEAGCSHC